MNNHIQQCPFRPINCQYCDKMVVTQYLKVFNSNNFNFLSQTSFHLKHHQLEHTSISNKHQFPTIPCQGSLKFKHFSLFQTSLYLKHPSISNIPLSQTSLYLKHPSISNIPLFQTSLYLKHSLSQTFLYLKHPTISNIPLSQTSLYLKHPSISNIPRQRDV